MKFPFEQVESRLREFGECKYVYSRVIPLSDIRIAAEPIENPFDFSEKSGKWRAFHVGGAWPKIDSYYWLHIPIQVPGGMPDGPFELLIQLSKEYNLHTPEGLVFVNGSARRGVDRMHHCVRLCESSKRMKEIQIAARVYTGAPMDGIRPAAVRPAHLEECALAVLDEPTRDFYHLAKSLHGALATMPDNSWVRGQLLDLLVQAFHIVDYRYPRSEEFYQSIELSSRFLREEIRAIPAAPLPETVTGVGQSHIDAAWLWPLRRAREKCVHTFSSVLDLMSRYPEFHYFQSQAQFYESIKQDQPVLFRQIKERIKSGQWEADGGMWVEADCNLPCGESLARQLLYGQRFFEEELGVKSSALWLPDAFGFNGALPQMLRLAEIDSFVTSKLSWNQYNQMPFDAFRWRGVDGSEVMAYFITAPCPGGYTTYNGLMEPAEIKGTWDRFNPKTLTNDVLLPFGYGDGGGGPTEEMLLTARSLNGVPGFPTIRLGRVDDFLRRLRQASGRAPVWEGELYLEYHRGTYTSQAQQKKRNRETEIRMQQTEFAAALAALAGMAYPRERLRKVWERILLNQFHDIIPGSSIREVYEESARDYDWIGDEMLEIVAESSKTFLHRGKRNVCTAINTLGWRRTEPFALEGVETEKTLLDANGNLIETQTIFTIDDETKILARWPLASFSANSFVEGEIREGETPSSLIRKTSVTPIKPAKTAPPMNPLRITNRMMENEIVKIAFNANGELISVYDKEIGREVLAKGEPGNVFQAFEDKPLRWDAWDIELYYQDKLLSTGGGKASFDIVQRGPLCATLRVRKTILDGNIEQYISIYSGSRRIDFDTRIEWANKDTLLKAAFPVAVHAAAATYDIQFGNVQRPTHWNTPWDWARFETCAQKWVDLSEGDYGVSLLNNGKYGHDIHGNILRLTLIKCAGAPDPMADLGEHRFAYCLYPHPGDWRAARIPQKAVEFNAPPLVLEGAWKHPALPESASVVVVDRENVIVETVKMAEKEDALIVRLFECYNQRGTLTVSFHRPPKSVSECNLLERRDQSIKIEGHSVRLQINPYEIKTLKVQFE